MKPGPSRLLPLIAASAALHGLVLVAGPDPLTIATAPAGRGHEVSIRLEAAAPAGAAAVSGPMGSSATARPSPARRTQPPTRDVSTLARAERPIEQRPESPEGVQETQPERSQAAPTEPRTKPADADQASPVQASEPSEPLAETRMPASGADRTRSTARRTDVQAAIVAELAQHFRYPRLAQRRGWEGTVVLNVRILPDGRLDEVGVKRSSGRALLDQAAVRALAHVRSLPEFAGRVGAEGLALEIPVTYRLESA